jgi:hypothetical protein
MIFQKLRHALGVMPQRKEFDGNSVPASRKTPMRSGTLVLAESMLRISLSQALLGRPFAGDTVICIVPNFSAPAHFSSLNLQLHLLTKAELA